MEIVLGRRIATLLCLKDWLFGGVAGGEGMVGQLLKKKQQLKLLGDAISG